MFFYLCFLIILAFSNMKIVVNNQDKSVTAQTIEELIAELQIESRGVAIAINGAVVSRTQWSERSLSEGDKVVVVSAVFGG